MILKPHARVDWTDFERAAPEVVAALRALGMAVDASGLEKTLTELIKVRASQLNGCAYCLQFHLTSARKLPIAPAKLDLVATWRRGARPGRFRHASVLHWHGPKP